MGVVYCGVIRKIGILYLLILTTAQLPLLKLVFLVFILNYTELTIPSHYQVESRACDLMLNTTSESFTVARKNGDLNREEAVRTFLRACTPSLEHFLPVLLRSGLEDSLDLKSLALAFGIAEQCEKIRVAKK